MGSAFLALKAGFLPVEKRDSSKKSKKDGIKNNEQKKKKQGGEKTFSKNAKKSKKGVDFAEMLCYNNTRRRETDLPTTENLGV